MEKHTQSVQELPEFIQGLATKKANQNNVGKLSKKNIQTYFTSLRIQKNGI